MKQIGFGNAGDYTGRPRDDEAQYGPAGPREIAPSGKTVGLNDTIYQHAEANVDTVKNLLFSGKNALVEEDPWHILTIPLHLWPWFKNIIALKAGGFSIWATMFDLYRGQYKPFKYRFGRGKHEENFESYQENTNWDYVDAATNLYLNRSKVTPMGYKNVVLANTILTCSAKHTIQMQVSETLAVYGDCIIDVGGGDPYDQKDGVPSNGSKAVREVVDWVINFDPSLCRGANGANGGKGNSPSFGHVAGGGGAGGGGGGLIFFGNGGIGGSGDSGGAVGAIVGAGAGVGATVGAGGIGGVGRRRAGAVGLAGNEGTSRTDGNVRKYAKGGAGGAGGSASAGGGPGGVGAGGGGICIIEAYDIIGEGRLIIRANGGSGANGGAGGVKTNSIIFSGDSVGGRGGGGGGGGGGIIFVAYHTKSPDVEIELDVSGGPGGNWALSGSDGYKTEIVYE